MNFTLDENLKQYATDRQWEILSAWEKHGSQREAAKQLGINKKRFYDVQKAVLKHAAMHGYSPDHDMTRTVPDPYLVKGVSTYYGDDGLPRGQWVKSVIDGDKRKELMDAAIKAMCEEIKPLAPSEFDFSCNENLLTKYIFTDSHVGMLAWHREGGSNWNLDIAESVLTGAFVHAIKHSPKSKVGYICQLGDFLHFDGIEAVTPTSGHVLDSDGRFGKVVEFAIRILRRIIDTALTHHEYVHVVMAEGNHDLASSVWLRKLFKALYENDKRVTVDDSELPYYAYHWGKTMLCCHHGHLKRFADLDRVMAAYFPKIWGDTDHRYCDVGHWHHKQVKENFGMIVEQHQTLAAKDAYASRGGYVAGRSMAAVTYDKEFGEVSRISVQPEMFMPKGYDK